MSQTPAALVGSNVRAEMVRAGLNQTQLAAALGTSQAYVSRRMLGNPPFDVDDLARIAVILRVGVAALLAGLNGAHK